MLIDIDRSSVSYINSDDAKFMELMDDFQKAMESLIAGIRTLLSMYCETFHVSYICPDLPHSPRGKY